MGTTRDRGGVIRPEYLSRKPLGGAVGCLQSVKLIVAEKCPFAAFQPAATRTTNGTPQYLMPGDRHCVLRGID
eukprot:1653374-Rhodomonas_salina.2